MRYMIDTCIVSFIVDGCKFSPVVDDILNDYNNQFFVSVESVKELIVMYRRKRMFKKKYKSERDLIVQFLMFMVSKLFQQQSRLC